MVDARLRSQILKSIGSWIAAGEIPENGMLPPLRKLSSMLNVSVVTLREAIVSLQTLGIVEMKHGKGVCVISPETIIDDMFQTRRELEAVMARRAAKVMSDCGLEVMHRHATAMEVAAKSGDIIGYGEHDTPFHKAIFEESGSSVMATIASLVKTGLFHPGSYLYDEVSQDRSYLTKANRDHWAIYEAMASHDPVRAEALVRAHLDRAYAVWSRNLDSMRTKVRSELAQMT